MNFFETLILGLIASAEAVAPIFLHSKNGLLVLNATEPIVNGAINLVLAQQAAAKVAAVETPVIVPPPIPKV